jgi:hypothetical protein
MGNDDQGATEQGSKGVHALLLMHSFKLRTVWEEMRHNPENITRPQTFEHRDQAAFGNADPLYNRREIRFRPRASLLLSLSQASLRIQDALIPWGC